MISNGETFPKPEAMSICAPYGIIPCTKQENISNKLALRRGSIWKRVAISFAIGPAIIRAIVLLAVHKLAKLTSPAILASAPRAINTGRQLLDDPFDSTIISDHFQHTTCQKRYDNQFTHAGDTISHRSIPGPDIKCARQQTGDTR